MKNFRTLLAVALLTFGAAAHPATFNLFQPASGVLVGNPNTYVTGAATSADILALWTGTCSAATYLRGDGACAAASSATGANPTATIGLTAVNGSSGNFIRADGAPALSQAIAPTWTAQHLFSSTAGSGAVQATSSAPVIAWNETDAAVDNRLWRARSNNAALDLEAVNDAASSSTPFLRASRTGLTIDSLALTSTALTWNGSAMVNIASSPTWTGTHTFQGSAPRTMLRSSGAAADQKLWHLQSGSSGAFNLSTRTDADGTGESAITILRTGVSVDTIQFAADLFTFAGPVQTTSSTPGYYWNETDAALDEKNWIARAVGAGTFAISTATDAAPTAAAATALQIDRTGTTVDSVALTATNVTVNGSEVCRASGVGCPAGGGDATLAGNQTFSGQNTFSNTTPITLSGADASIRKSTDTDRLLLLGGTANNVSNGSRMSLYGSSHASRAGDIELTAGTGGDVTITNATTVSAALSATGQTLVGGTSAQSVGTIGTAAGLQVNSDTATNRPGFGLTRFTADASPPYLSLGKSRGTTYGTYTIVQAGDELGRLEYAGADGTDLATPGADIRVEVDGTPGANDMPGRLVFRTTADGANSTTERMRIANSGALGFAGANYGTAGQILVSAGSGAPPAWNASNSFTSSAVLLQSDSGLSVRRTGASSTAPYIALQDSGGTDLAYFQASTASTDVFIQNVQSGGDVDILTSGGGTLKLNGSPVPSATTGTFLGTLTGFASSPSGTINYSVNAGIVTLWNNGSSITGTSNSSSMTMTGLPAAVTPSGSIRTVPCAVIDPAQSGVTVTGHALVTTSNTITFLSNTSGGAFGASGSKGLNGGWTITYPL